MKWIHLRRMVFVVLCLTLVISFIACSDDENEIPFKGAKAYLMSVSLSAGTISFDPGIMEYAVFLGASNSTVAITPVSYSSDDTITVNGASVVSGNAANVSLVAGSGNASITVQSPGKAASTYKIDFINYDSDARITSIVPSNGAFNMPFLPMRTSGYTLKTGSLSFSLTITASHPEAVITINGSPANNGAPTAIPFTSNGNYPLSVVVRSKDGTQTKSYSLTITYSWVPDYTTVNYDFDGGIAAYLASLPAAEASNGTTYSTPTVLTGIVTATDIYMHSTGSKSFCIQDRDRGIIIFTSDPPAVSVGDKISIRALTGKVYYGQPEVLTFDNFSKISEKNNIYYKTGAYNSSSARGDFYMYEGTVTKSMDSFSVGYFTSTLGFHGDSRASWAEYLAEGMTGRFYGPVNYSYSVYRLEISSEGQIDLD